MTKVITLATKYWYLIAIAILGVVVLLKKKKVEVPDLDKDEEAVKELVNQRVRDNVAKNHYKTVALQIAENLGTAYPWYDPRYLTENDEDVYNLVRDLNQKDFDIVSALYFKVYAKGRNLSEDLAKLLDGKLYALLTVK